MEAAVAVKKHVDGKRHEVGGAFGSWFGFEGGTPGRAGERGVVHGGTLGAHAGSRLSHIDPICC